MERQLIKKSTLSSSECIMSLNRPKQFAISHSWEKNDESDDGRRAFCRQPQRSRNIVGGVSITREMGRVFARQRDNEITVLKTSYALKRNMWLGRIKCATSVLEIFITKLCSNQNRVSSFIKGLYDVPIYLESEISFYFPVLIDQIILRKV